MKVFHKQLIASTFSNFVGVGLGILINLWLLPKFLDAEGIGLYRWLDRTAVLVSSFALFGVHTVYVRFQSQFQSTVRPYFLAKTVRSIIWLSLMACVVLSLCIYVFGGETEQQYALPLGVWTSGLMLFIAGLSLSSVKQKLFVPYLVKNVFTRLVISALLFLIQWGFIEYYGFIWAASLVNLILGIYVFGASARHNEWDTKAQPGEYPILKKELVSFGLSGVLSTFVWMSLATMDSQIIYVQLGSAVLGTYSIAFFLGTFVDHIRRPLTQGLNPTFANLWNEGNFEALSRVYKKSALTLTLAASLATYALIVNLDFIYSLIPNSETYISGKPVVILLVLTRLVDFSFGSNGELLSNSSHYKWNLRLMSVLVLSVAVGEYFAAMYFGLTGIAYALLLAYAVFNVVKVIKLKKEIGVWPFSNEQGIILAVTGGGVAISYGIRLENELLEVVVKNAILLGFMLPLFVRNKGLLFAKKK